MPSCDRQKGETMSDRFVVVDGSGRRVQRCEFATAAVRLIDGQIGWSIDSLKTGVRLWSEGFEKYSAGELLEVIAVVYERERNALAAVGMVAQPAYDEMRYETR